MTFRGVIMLTLCHPQCLALLLGLVCLAQLSLSAATSDRAATEIIDGKAPLRIPSVEETCFTYYKIVGDLSSGVTPVVVIHGGPGAGHEYLLPYGDLWRDYGLPVVFYDQIGCASSTHLRRKNGDESFWREQLFQDELDNLLDHLRLREGPGFHVLGHSWGGMLGAAFAARRPRGLKRLILASGLASAELHTQGSNLWRELMPAVYQEAIDEAERTGKYNTPGFRDAMAFYRKEHVYRSIPFPPPELVPALRHMKEDPTTYSTMYGPSSLRMTGSLRNWTVVPRLHNISAPTLVFNGEYDSSHDIAQVPFFQLIPRVRWVTFPDSGHLCHLEGGVKIMVLKEVGEFLTQHTDAAPTGDDES